MGQVQVAWADEPQPTLRDQVMDLLRLASTESKVVDEYSKEAYMHRRAQILALTRIGDLLEQLVNDKDGDRT